jgi:ferredoxin-NADP reductase
VVEAIKTIKSDLLEKEQLTQDVLKLTFSAPEDFEFLAGQFVSIKCEKDDESRRKSYSILNAPSKKGVIEICIKIIKGGFASSVLESSKIGDKFEIKGPLGHFTLDEKTKNEHWFLAAGTGVTPFHSMIQEYIDSKIKMNLLFGVRSKKNLFLNKEFLDLERNHDNFSYNPVLSREKWNGSTGHVQDNLPEDLNGKTFYVCGLKELVIETEELLLKKGVKKENIRKERYS